MKNKRREGKTQLERGQVLLFIALAFVGLLVFVGLAVDVGALFIGMGQLRRGVDSAALAAAAQFREGRSYSEIQSAADEFFQLNITQPISHTIDVQTCDTKPSLCPDYKRKFVQVTGEADIPFNFLSIIGWSQVRISAEAESEAASLDVVLVLDTSESMAYDASCDDGDDDDRDGKKDECGDWNGDGVVDDLDKPGWGPNGLEDDYYRDPKICNKDPLKWTEDDKDGIPGDCHPFEEVLEAAIEFVKSLNYPYDRVAIVSYAREGAIEFDLQTLASYVPAEDAIKKLQVADRPIPGVEPCLWDGEGTDPSGCTSTSVGGGLVRAAEAFTNPVGGPNQIRDEALWVTILLSDGSANASVRNPKKPSVVNIYCPKSTWWPPPFCRDKFGVTRHSIIPGPKNNPNNTYDEDNYDADDFARDMADLVGCPTDSPKAGSWCHDSLNYPAGKGGQNALIFTIGLGEALIKNKYGDPDAGEQLLRYVAAVGDDGDPSTSPSCKATPSGGKICGNYYFTKNTDDLLKIFEDIASRIFTRLTR